MLSKTTKSDFESQGTSKPYSRNKYIKNQGHQLLLKKKYLLETELNRTADILYVFPKQKTFKTEPGISNVRNATARFDSPKKHRKLIFRNIFRFIRIIRVKE